jgi:hypothetical protein
MISTLTEYVLTGIVLDAEKGELRVDLNQPRTITVRAVNELTRQEKTYILKVTAKGLCLV